MLACAAARTLPLEWRAVWRPVLQFLLLGAVLFAADRLWSREEPAPVVIPAARVEAVRAELAAWQQRAPSEAELARALEGEIEEELLYREALRRGYDRGDPVVFRRLVQNLRFAGAAPERDDAELYREALEMGLHESDIVVRRRLVQRMRLDLEAAALAEEPGEAELRAHFEAHRERYTSPARVAFQQAYYREERVEAAEQALAALRAADAPPEARPDGADPFLHSATQPSQSHEELAERFGAAFADAAFAAEPGRWSGPLPSAYGHHLVHVRERVPARALPFEEVRERVRLSLLGERRERALREGVAALRAEAEVRIESVSGAAS